MKTSIRTALIQTLQMVATIGVAIAIGSHVPAWYQQWRGPGKQGDFSIHVANQPQRLTLYGTATCPYCIKARAYLTQAGIPFNDRLVEKSQEADAMFAKLNEKSVPVLVSERALIVGFDQSAYDVLINKLIPQ